MSSSPSRPLAGPFESCFQICVGFALSKCSNIDCHTVELALLIFWAWFFEALWHPVALGVCLASHCNVPKLQLVAKPLGQRGRVGTGGDTRVLLRPASQVLIVCSEDLLGLVSK
jgi:hypothetical protein